MPINIFELEAIITKYSPLLQDLQQDKVSYKPTPGKWSKKELIGHMIDSAQNNIRRFIVGQYEDKPVIKYAQDHWVMAAGYRDYPLDELVQLWILLNKHIIRILKNIPENIQQRIIQTEDLHSIEWLAEDYNKHLLHHLHQVLELEPVIRGVLNIFPGNLWQNSLHLSGIHWWRMNCKGKRNLINTFYSW